MIDEYWILNTCGFTVCINSLDANRVNQWLNEARLSDRYKTIIVNDIHSGAENIIILDSVNFLVHSTVESRRIAEEHEQMLEKEKKENARYDL